MTVNLNHSKILFLTGCLLICTIATVLILSSLSFFVGIGISSWQFPASFILTGVLFFCVSKSYYDSATIFFKALLCTLAIIIVSVFVALYFYDVSYDGQSYHQEGIYQLKNGWNPFKKLLPETVNMAIYINHYSKAVEIPQSALYSLIKHIEVAKATNFMLLASAFCLSLSFLLSLNKLSIFKCILLSLLISLNPIAVNQLITTYVDGQLAILLLCFLVTVLWVIKDASYGNLLLLSAIIIITSNIKFTGLVYMVIFTIALLAWLLFTKKAALLKKVFLTATLAGIVAIFIVGYNPYVVNTIKFDHPFYPLMGKKKVDIMGYNMPNGFEGKNGASKFFLSLFAHTDNVTPDNGRRVELKIPFAINKTDIVNASKIDTRIAGLGPLFSGLILLSVILIAVLLAKSGSYPILKNGVYLLVVIILSVSIMPESWWARYIPQLWFIPIIILICSELYAAGKWKLLKFIIYGMVIINIGFTFIGFGWNLMMSSLVKYQMAKLKASNQTIIVQWGSAQSNRIRFMEFGIPFIEKNLDNNPSTENIIRSDSKFVIPNSSTNISKSKFVKWAENYQKATEK